jgi:6-phosphogluconolactonase
MISVFPNLELLSRAAADMILRSARHAVRLHGRFVIALSGGRTPRRTYELLAASPLREQMPWSRVNVFWGDERCVPADDERSNQRMAREALLDHVPILAEHVHPVECVDSPRQSAERYERALRQCLGDSQPLDLVLLGLGEDGHTASLFPNAPTLEERTRWAAEARDPQQQLDRVTLTVPRLNNARAIVFLVSGPRKARALQAVRSGPRDPHRLPAQLVRPFSDDLRWLVDEAAVARLVQKDA